MTMLPLHFVPAPLAPAGKPPHEFPSVLVYTSKDTYAVGWRAEAFLRKNPDYRDAACYLLKYRLGEEDEPVHIRLPSGEQWQRSRVEVIGDYLRGLQQAADEYFRGLVEAGRLDPAALEALDHVTISKPGKQQEQQDAFSRALQEGARLAGFKGVALYEEPAATYQAALAAGFVDQLESGELLLVVDIGGGTTDLSLVEGMPEGDVKVREALEGGEWAAGWSLDLNLWTLLRAQMLVRDQFSTAASRDYVVQLTDLRKDFFLWSEVEKQKRALIERLLGAEKPPERHKVEFYLHHHDEVVRVDVQRREFIEKVIDPVIGEIDQAVNAFQEKAKVLLRQNNVLQQLILTGGSSTVPSFHNYFMTRFRLATYTNAGAKIGRKKYTDRDGKPLVGPKTLVGGGCALRPGQLARRVKLLAEMQNASGDAERTRQNLRDLELINPTRAEQITLEVIFPDQRKPISFRLGQGRVRMPLPWNEVLSEGLRLPGVGRRETWRVRVHVAGGQDPTLREPDFAVGITDAADMEKWVKDAEQRQQQRMAFYRLEHAQETANQLITTYYAGAKPSDQARDAVVLAIMILLTQRPEGCWGRSLREVRDWLLSQVENQEAAGMLSRLKDGPRGYYPVRESYSKLFRDLRLYLDVFIGEDGNLMIDTDYSPRKSEGVAFKRRKLSLGRCFQTEDVQAADLEKAAPPAQPPLWSLGIDFGTSASLVALACHGD